VNLATFVLDLETSLQLLARLELIKVIPVKKNVKHATLDIIAQLKVYQRKLKIAQMDFTARPERLMDNIIRVLLEQLVTVLTLKRKRIALHARQVALVHIKAIRRQTLMNYLFAHLEYTALLVATLSIFSMELLVKPDIIVHQAQRPILRALDR